MAPVCEEYVEAFRLEAREDLARLRACLTGLDGSGAESGAVEEASRAAITLKNAAATMGFRAVRDVAHAVGDLLHAWRNGGIREPGSIPPLLGSAVGLLADCLQHLEESGGPEPEVADLLVQLRAVAGGTDHTLPAIDIGDDLDPAEQRFAVSVRLEEPCPEPLGRFLVCRGYLLELGRIIDAERPTEDSPPVMRFLLETTAELALVRGRVESIPHVRAVEVTAAPAGQDTLPPARPRQKRSGAAVLGRDLRLDIQRLEELENAAGQLREIRAAYRALEHELQAANPGAAYRLARLGARFEHPLHRLSETLARMRQVEAEILLQRLSAKAAAQARVLGREVEVRTAGGETPCGLDQMEAALPTLERMLGFLLAEEAEEPAERQHAGKTRRNRLEIKAETVDGRFILRLSIDGRGNLSAPGETIGAWQEELAACGGTLDLQSWPGQGSMIQVETACVESWLDILAVELGRDLFAIPLAAVVEARRAAAGDVAWIDGQAFCAWNQETLPLYDLGVILGRPAPKEGGYWLFVRPAEGGYILRVPSVLGSRRATASPGTGLRLPCLNGLCMDSGGRIYFLLSPSELGRQGAVLASRPAEAGS